MPVTKTAKRALRVSNRKKIVNKNFQTRLELALRKTKKKKDSKGVANAVSLLDRAVKKGLMHKNKAARIKSSLTKRSSAKK